VRKSLYKLIPVFVLLITISSVNQWTDLPIGNTTFWWLIYSCCLFIFIKSKSFFFDVSNNKNIRSLYLFLVWCIISIVRGFFVAENYWEWKNLISTSLILLLPLSIFISTSRDIVQKILVVWIKYAFPAFLLFFAFLHTEAIGRYLIPISFLFLFFPALTKKWKLFVFLASVFVLLIDFSARSNVIKFTIPILLCSIYYIGILQNNRLLKIIRFVLLLAPIILFCLAISDIFNVFKIDEYIKGDYSTNVISNGELKEESLTVDTRTFLYKEVIHSSIKHSYVFFGRTPARGNDSESFGSYLAENLGTGKNERFSNEVSILNMYTWTGFIGLILYFLIFYKATYFAIYKSNSIYIKVMGIYIAFRWCYAWVEDFSRFDLSNLFLWIMIGMCFSKSFRSMTDFEIKLWIRGVFDKKYVLKAFRYEQYKLSKKINETN